MSIGRGLGGRTSGDEKGGAEMKKILVLLAVLFLLYSPLHVYPLQQTSNMSVPKIQTNTITLTANGQRKSQPRIL